MIEMIDNLSLLFLLIIAFASGLVGVFILLRKEELFADGIAHASFGGIGLSYLLPFNNPFITAFLTSSSLYFLINRYLTKKPHTTLSLIFITGLSIGIIIFHNLNIEMHQLEELLFGQGIKSIQPLMIIVSLISLTYIYLNSYKIFSLEFDKEGARVYWKDSSLTEFLFTLALIGLIITNVFIVGVLFSSVLIVLPALITLEFAKSFKQHMIMSGLLASLTTLITLHISSAELFSAFAALFLISLYIITKIIKMLFINKK